MLVRVQPCQPFCVRVGVQVVGQPARLLTAVSGGSSPLSDTKLEGETTWGRIERFRKVDAWCVGRRRAPPIRTDCVDALNVERSSGRFEERNTTGRSSAVERQVEALCVGSSILSVPASSCWL